MRILSALLALIILFSVNCLWAISKHSLVLATSATSDLPALTMQEARKLFLGVPLEKNGERFIPLLNTSDSLTYEVFLQKVAFMSSSAYEAQTVSIVFRLGGKRPESFSDLKTLVQTLQQNQRAVTFLWEDQVQANQGIKSISVLWQDSSE